MKLNLKAAIFDRSKYAFHEVVKPFNIKTSKGVLYAEKGSILGLREATSNKNKIRIIDYENPNMVVSIDKKDVDKLAKFLKYRSDIK